MRILLIEDDFMLGEACHTGLMQEAHAVDWVRSRADAISSVFEHPYDLVLLDLGLPDGDGIDVLRSMRKNKQRIPVIILTAKDRVSDKIAGLDLGADDYIVKPIDLHELYARIRAVHRRLSVEELDNIISCNGLKIDISALKGWYLDKPVDLGAKEIRILQKLIEQKDKIVTKEQLESMLYSWGHEVESNAVEVHIHRIRKKTSKKLIKTIRFGGYMIENG